MTNVPLNRQLKISYSPDALRQTLGEEVGANISNKQLAVAADTIFGDSEELWDLVATLSKQTLALAAELQKDTLQSSQPVRVIDWQDFMFVVDENGDVYAQEYVEDVRPEQVAGLVNGMGLLLADNAGVPLEHYYVKDEEAIGAFLGDNIEDQTGDFLGVADILAVLQAGSTIGLEKY